MLLPVHLEILRRAATGDLPSTIDAQSGIDLTGFSLLWRAGLVDAVNASGDKGECFLHPAVTLAGLAHLGDHRQSD